MWESVLGFGGGEGRGMGGVEKVRRDGVCEEVGGGRCGRVCGEVCWSMGGGEGRGMWGVGEGKGR